MGRFCGQWSPTARGTRLGRGPNVSEFFVTPGTPLFQPNLIFPFLCEFIAADLPQCAVIRPSDDRFAGAKATIASFTADGLFVGQSTQFFDVVNQLADEADAASRQV